jgi:protein SCO1
MGQYLFATRCAACLTIGHGDVVGPDLRGVTLMRDEAWLARFIKHTSVPPTSFDLK